MKINQIIKRLGGAKNIADGLGISSQAVSQWKQVPAHHVLHLEVYSSLGSPADMVTRYDMRPDIFGEKGE